MITADTSEHPDHHSGKHAELELNFWDLYPKEHLHSRLKALSLYEGAHVFIMVYNADDRESFSRLVAIHNDFLDQNQLDAY